MVTAPVNRTKFLHPSSQATKGLIIACSIGLALWRLDLGLVSAALSGFGLGLIQPKISDAPMNPKTKFAGAFGFVVVSFVVFGLEFLGVLWLVKVLHSQIFFAILCPYIVFMIALSSSKVIKVIRSQG